jgi:hypothetical protein
VKSIVGVTTVLTLSTYYFLHRSVGGTFNELSQQIIEVEKEIRSSGRVDHANLVKQLQGAEAEHLKLTVTLHKWHLKKYGVLPMKLSPDEPDLEDDGHAAFVEKSITGLRQEASDNLIEINDFVSELAVELAEM